MQYNLYSVFVQSLYHVLHRKLRIIDRAEGGLWRKIVAILKAPQIVSLGFFFRLYRTGNPFHALLIFIAWHKLHGINAKLLQVRDLFHQPFKGAPLFHSGAFVHGKASYIQSIKNHILKGTLAFLFLFPVKGLICQCSGNPLSFGISPFLKAKNSFGIGIRKNLCALVIVVAPFCGINSFYDNSV